MGSDEGFALYGRNWVDNNKSSQGNLELAEQDQMTKGVKQSREKAGFQFSPQEVESSL